MGNGNGGEERIQELWRRRGTLDAKEWTELCERIFVYLDAVAFTEYRTLAKAYAEFDRATLKRHLIWGFIVNKVFMPAVGNPDRMRELDHPAVLRTYYRRYLWDEMKGECRYVPLPDGFEDHSGDGASPEDDAEPGAGGGQGLGAGAAPTAEAADQEDGGEDREEWCRSAEQFMKQAENWVVLYLGRNYCVEQEDRVGLVWLAQQYGIRNYAQKARELGGVRPHGGYAPEAPWSETTMIGRWIRTLGIQPERNGQAEYTRRIGAQLTAALKILCAAAFKELEEREL